MINYKTLIKTVSIFSIILTCSVYTYSRSAVTYTLSGGREGDNLIAYAHAKWVEYKYKIPLLYKKFKYSDQLMLSTFDNEYTSEYAKNFRKKIILRRNQSLDEFMSNDDGSTLFIIPYFPESLAEIKGVYCPILNFINHNKQFPYFEVNWKDPKFKAILKVTIAAKKRLDLINIPKDCLSIGIHVRKNGNGFDLPFLHNCKEGEYNKKQKYVDAVFPLKHPPEEYYIQQLQYIFDNIAVENYFVFIFTDDINPQAICERFQKATNQHDKNVSWHYRVENNDHKHNVLEDFFSMTKFDCLIRPDANLSIIASKIGHNKIIISPTEYHWEGTKLIINDVKIDIQ